MRITYDPENLSGAERYLVSVNACHSAEVSTWLEAAVIKALVGAVARKDEFPIIYRGIGFFYSVIGRSSAPKFSSEFEPAEPMSDDTNALLDVTFWVAADAVPG